MGECFQRCDEARRGRDLSHAAKGHGKKRLRRGVCTGEAMNIKSIVVPSKFQTNCTPQPCEKLHCLINFQHSPFQHCKQVRSFRRGLSESQRAARRATTLAQLQASHEAAVARREQAAAEALLNSPEPSHLSLLQSAAPMRLDRCLRPCTACKKVRTRCEQPPKTEISGEADNAAAAADTTSSCATCARCLRLGLVCEVPPDQPLRRPSVAPSGTSGGGKRSSSASKPYTGGKRTRKRDLSGRPAGCKLIERFDPDNPDVVLDVYPSGSTCAVALGVSANDVSDVARGKKAHIHGIFLRFQPWVPPPEQPPEVPDDGGASTQPDPHPPVQEGEYEDCPAKKAAPSTGGKHDYYSGSSDDPMAELIAAAEAAAAASAAANAYTETSGTAGAAPVVAPAAAEAAPEVPLVETTTVVTTDKEAGTGVEEPISQAAAIVETAPSASTAGGSASSAPTATSLSETTAIVQAALPESAQASPPPPVVAASALLPATTPALPEALPVALLEAVNHQPEAAAPVIEATPAPEPIAPTAMDAAPDASALMMAAFDNPVSGNSSDSALGDPLTNTTIDVVPTEDAMELDHRGATGDHALAKEDEVVTASPSAVTQESTATAAAEATCADPAADWATPAPMTAHASAAALGPEVQVSTDALAVSESRLMFNPSSSNSSTTALADTTRSSSSCMEVDMSGTTIEGAATVDERDSGVETDTALSFGLALLGSVASAASSAPPTPVGADAPPEAQSSWGSASAPPALSFPALASALDATLPSLAMTSAPLSAEAMTSSSFSSSSSSSSSAPSSSLSSLSAGATEGSVSGGGGRQTTENLNETISAQLLRLPHSE